MRSSRTATFKANRNTAVRQSSKRNSVALEPLIEEEKQSSHAPSVHTAPGQYGDIMGIRNQIEIEKSTGTSSQNSFKQRLVMYDSSE